MVSEKEKLLLILILLRPIAATGLSITAQTYPITVGAGGTAAPGGSNTAHRGGQGGSSTFATITSSCSNLSNFNSKSEIPSPG